MSTVLCLQDLQDVEEPPRRLRALRGLGQPVLTSDSKAMMEAVIQKLHPTLQGLFKSLAVEERAAIDEIGAGVMQQAIQAATSAAVPLIRQGKTTEARNAAIGAANAVRSRVLKGAYVGEIQAVLSRKYAGQPVGVYAHRISLISQLFMRLIEGISTPVADEVMKQAGRVRASGKALLDAIESVPWPHAYFKTFVTAPKARQAPFFSGIGIRDLASLEEAGYFTGRSPEAVKGDLARWLLANDTGLQDHFQKEFEAYVAAKERAAKKKAKKRGVVGKILSIVGFVATPFLPMAGGLAVSALSAGRKIYEAKKLSKDQIKAMKQIQSMLNISDAALDRFSAWMIKYAGVSSEPAAYTVTVEGQPVAQASSPAQATQVALSASKPGDRIEITGSPAPRTVPAQPLGYWVRTATGTQAVPPALQRGVESLPRSEVAEAVKKTGEPGTPWWVYAAIPVAVVAVTS